MSPFSRGFRALLITQFLGALNDNLFKTTLSLLVVASASNEAAQGRMLSLASSMLVIPYLLFSSYAGYLADRFRKSDVIRAVKAFEIVIVVLAFIFLIKSHILPLFFVLFLMGLHSALFSPSKYGVMPEILSSEELSKGNGYLNSTTFLAILLGTALGGILLEIGPTVPGYVMLFFAGLGLFTSFLMPPTPRPAQSRSFSFNPWSDVWHTAKEILSERPIYLSIIAITYFWFLGAILHLNIFLYSSQLLHVGKIPTSILLASLAIGIGAGSILAGLVSEGKVELGLVPLGSIGVTLSLLAMAILPPDFYLMLILLLVLGVSAGLYLVPLEAFLQHASPQHKRGSYIATGNFVTFVGVLAASLVLWISTDLLSLSPRAICGALAIFTLACSIYIVNMMPEILLRCINWVLTHTFYRLDVRGASRIPKEGGALLVSNHLSFIDALLILACARRSVRFLMYGPIYSSRFFGPIARIARVIPIDGKKGREHVSLALSTAREAIKSGDLVGIFPEGGISRLGVLLPFKSGMRDIMTGVDAPVIPVHLDQLWGSIFSFRFGKILGSWPRQIPYPVTVSFGPPLPPDVSPFEARQAVAELSVNAVRTRPFAGASLTDRIILQATSSPLKISVIDKDGTTFTFADLIELSERLACQLQREDIEGRFVGVLIPPGASNIIAHLALLLIKKVPVQLDPSLDQTEILRRADIVKMQALLKLDTIPFSSGLKALNISPGKPLSSVERLKVATYIFLRLRNRVWRKNGLGGNDLAAVTYTAGRSGSARAVAYSHGGILRNILSLSELFQFGKQDKLSGLPFSNAFGLTLSCWLPLVEGVPVVFREFLSTAEAIASLKKSGVTWLFCSDTELSTLISSAKEDDLTSVTQVFVGGDSIEPEKIRNFEERFKRPVFEGYGVSELGPTIIASLPDFEEGRYRQVGKKEGMSGIALPGVVARILDSLNGSILPVNQEGDLWVKSASLAFGFVENGEVAPLSPEDWIKTGDRAQMDESGFVKILARTIP